MSRLLRARRHAGGRPGALHVEDHRRNFGEIREADELLHQRDAGAGRGGEGARAVPAGADHHADRGQFVLGLHDARSCSCPVSVSTRIPVAVAGERLGQRGGRRDRIPGADRRAAIDRAQRRGAVAVDEDAVADRVGAAHAQPDRAVQVRLRLVAADMQRVDVGGDQLVPALELLGQQLLDRPPAPCPAAPTARRGR